MKRHEFLQGLHDVSKNRNYLEIGIRDGRSMALSRVPSIGIDPDYQVTAEIRCDVQLARATSDDFFAREDPMEYLKGSRSLDLSFIDGMHLFEFAFRDFINVEKYSNWSSVIVFDDMLPRNVYEATRNHHAGAWTGDVYKVIEILNRYRPELETFMIDTQPTGLLAVFGADPTSTTLEDKYDEIIAEFMVDDPQTVPEAILKRTSTIKPDLLLEAGFWDSLVRARNLGFERTRGWGPLRAALQQLRGHMAPTVASGPPASPRGSRSWASPSTIKDRSSESPSPTWGPLTLSRGRT